MAYKDDYQIACLLTADSFMQQVRALSNDLEPVPDTGLTPWVEAVQQAQGSLRIGNADARRQGGKGGAARHLYVVDVAAGATLAGPRMSCCSRRMCR